MTEGQKVHRLLGCLYHESKKAIFYEDLLEEFNDGLWMGKIDETALKSLCTILVRDELANYITGSHAAAGVPSDKDSSKGISITNNAYIAFINKKYVAGEEASSLPKVATIVSALIAVAALAYIVYLRSETASRLEEAQRDFERVIMEKERAFARIDSIVMMKDSVIKRHTLRIKDLEAKLAAAKTPPPKKPAKRRR